MITKEIWKEIEHQIHYVWRHEISEDYARGKLWKEDSLKCSLYHHLRMCMENILDKYNLRIYPEYYVKATKQRVDLAIVEMDMDQSYYIKECVKNVVAVFELKYISEQRDIPWAKSDIYKMRNLLKNAGLDCHYFFTIIYENECDELYFMDKRSSNNWAKGRVTELNAGLIGDEMIFEVKQW